MAGLSAEDRSDECWMACLQQGQTGALDELGVAHAFGSGADFSGMDGTLELFIDDVYHKAFIAVDEAGTEAAVASAVVMGCKGGTRPRVLAVDRYFLYLIRDVESGTILFLRHVIDPSA